jgi:hypothetical protein
LARSTINANGKRQEDLHLNNGNMARWVPRIASGGLLLATLASVAQAQSTVAPSGSSSADQSITWKGITLYGTVDIGVQYQTHGAPESDYFPAGTSSPIARFSDKSVTAVTPSNLGPSRIGLSGNEPLIGDWAGVFRLETWFNPQSGNIADGLKSLTLNNGKALPNYTTGVDTSLAGQALVDVVPRLQLADLRHLYLWASHHPARRRDPQVRSDGRIASVLANRLRGLDRRWR